MDSIAYLRDPTDDAKMTNVIKAHARYTVQSAKLLAEAQVQRYDKYDRTNDMAARTYLLASLSTGLTLQIVTSLRLNFIYIAIEPMFFVLDIMRFQIHTWPSVELMFGCS